MARRKFEFDLYRLNIVDAENEYETNAITNNVQIASVLKNMANEKFDYETEGRKSSACWCCRHFDQFLTSNKENVYKLILAKSVIEQDGVTVTASGLQSARSEINPPLAVSVVMFFFESRHLVAIEHNSALTGGKAWNSAFRIISERSAKDLGLNSYIALEAVPDKNSLLETLTSFKKLFRLRTKILLPNPELTRYTKILYEQLEQSAIREYTQDMRNQQNGLNTAEGSLVHSSVSLAEDGYSDGDLTFVGVRQKGKVEKVIVGKTAARGEVAISKEVIRLLESKDVFPTFLHPLDEINSEINRIHPIEEYIDDL